MHPIDRIGVPGADHPNWGAASSARSEEYAEHDHMERSHEGRGNEVIEPEEGLGRRRVPVKCHERLGGLLRYPCRAA